MRNFIATRFLSYFLVMLPFTSYGVPENKNTSTDFLPVKLGVDVLFEKHLELLRGKRVGLVTNPTGMSGSLKSTIELFHQHPEIKLVALYGPEHGVHGNSQAGEYVPYYFDKDYQLPVYSLYGQSKKPSKSMLKTIDKTMRAFDTQNQGKQVDPDILRSVDVIVLDLQDVGTRIYTYIATMNYVMEACAKAGIPVIVLDRPNPIGGITMEGPILEYPKYSSFIGLYPIPLRHGMTIGELALLFNEKFLSNKAKLTVIPMENWRRNEWFDQTSLPWVIPSPNLPTLNSAIVYPGQVLLEGTNLSEGRGTTQPFEIFGAPWVNGFVLAKKLNELHLPGVKFREVWFSPTFSKFQGKQCRGVQLHITNRETFQPVATTLAILSMVKQLYGKKLKFHGDYFDYVVGTSSIRTALERGESVKNITADFQPGLDNFFELRKPFLLY